MSERLKFYMNDKILLKFLIKFKIFSDLCKINLNNRSQWGFCEKKNQSPLHELARERKDLWYSMISKLLCITN